MWKIIIADEDNVSSAALCDYYRDSEVLIVSTVNRFDFLLPEISEYKPHAVVVDYSLLKQMCRERILQIVNRENSPQIIVVVSSAQDGTDAHEAYGNAYILYKPFRPDAILRGLKVILGEPKPDTRQVVTDISRMIGSIGLQPHLDGYKYMRDAIFLYTVNKGNISIGDIYMKVGEKYGKNAHCVERCMRNAIEKAWVNGNIDYIHSIFGYTIREDSGKPANREFIAMIADKLIIAR